MKLIMAVIRNEMYFKTRDALLDAGFHSMTVKDVLGRGKRALTPLDLVKPDAPGEKEVQTLEMYSKKMLEVCVRDAEAGRLIGLLVDVNRHDHPGDGKIFVLPVSGCTRIRTGERDDNAIL